jgi:class 3 adenylate cyclase
MLCPSCGQENPDGFLLCGMCGTPLAAPAAPREERKVVTVLFADLVGFTSRSEQLDPEDVRALLAPYWERLRFELESFGGTVEKFIGDAVVALFGAPVAHEDDPERAVRAALAIREWVAEESDLHVRIGVNTGEALVSLSAHPAQGEGMASGDVVNTAARLQSAAPVDGILVGEQTYRATARTIEYREHERIEAKGKAEPIPVWVALDARSRFGVDLSRPTDGPLVGRAEELAILRAALRRAADELVPQLVTLVGVPGIGKSRLLAELFAEIDRGDRLVMWRQGRSLPYGEGVSFWALGEMVKAQVGILETDSAEEATVKLEDALAGLLSDPAESAWVVSHLRALVGLSGGEVTRDQRTEAFAAWRRFFEALAEERPLVLVFEDLHWADDGLLDFVDDLVDWLRDVPLFVIGTARPELLTRRPAWAGGKANATTVSLRPLSDDDTALLVHALLQQSVLPAEMQSALLERAGGNPLYAGEFARMVAERAGTELELPSSVQGIIAARLDALDSADKRLLQDAAVVGKVFWSGALAAIGACERSEVEDRLRVLERRELVRRERRSSMARENEYAFLHVLVRDVAYGSIPRAERVERHRRAAEWIGSRGRPDDHADLLAHHYVSALELARATGSDTAAMAGSAASALQHAGERAFALNAFAPAARYFEDALMLGISDDEQPRVLFQRAAALHRSADESRIPLLEEARDALVATGQPELAAEACALLAEAWWDQGQTARGRAELECGRELVRDREPSRSVARVLLEVSRYAMLSDATEEAVEVGREALTIAETLGLDDLIPTALINIGSARANAGDEAGVADLERAIDMAARTNNPDLARAYNNRAAMESNLANAYEFQLKGKEAAERLGNAPVGRYIEGQLILTLADLGSWDEFEAEARDFLAACEAGSPHYNEGFVRERLADIRVARNDVEAAAPLAARALELARQAKEPQALQPALGCNIRVALARGRLEEARLLARELVDLMKVSTTSFGALTLALHADVLGVRDELPEILATRADRSWVRAATAALEDDFVRAADIAGEQGLVVDEAELRLRAAGALVAEGRRSEADVQLQQALGFFRSVRATRYVREAEALLAASA